MAQKQFQAESKRLLDLMIHSIYTHQEIFLRELISNASDAIDKHYYHALQSGESGLSRDSFAIQLTIDKENRLLTISDNGCGMTEEDLENNLGTIAKSGSLDFKKNAEQKEEIDIIGQFGVGFYSAFMVSDCITVISRVHGADKAWRWESCGADGYTIDPCEKADYGTDIILHIRDNTEEENYDEFLDAYRIRALVQKYSDYIRYPIRMEMEKTRLKEKSESEQSENDKPEYETYTEVETLNSMVPIWKKSRSEVTTEDYNEFYKEKFYDFEDPARVIYSSTEGTATYNALLFIPAHAPHNYYTRDYEKGLQLYASGVLIMDKCADLLPDCFSFVKGLVDSQDLSLNISREMLQHDRQLKIIASRLEKKIKSELLSMLQNDREKYDAFYQNFGLQLKYGAYGNYGANKDLLKDLLMFYSSSEQKLVTIPEYISRMKEDQKYIYYACGDTVEHIAALPQTELLKEKQFEILYLTEEVDEFCLSILHEYDGKEFKSVSSEDLDLESEEEKNDLKDRQEKNKDLLETMKTSLGDDKVEAVRLTKRLKSHPVCLTTEGGLSLEMEKVLQSMPGANEGIKARRVLEINADHPILLTLQKLYADDREKLSAYAKMLYTQALLIEGMPIEDPVAFSNQVCELMVEKQ